MKGLSLTQPWATLVALSAHYPSLGKHNETRSWGLSHRLPITIAIHAAKGLGPVGGKRGLLDLIEQEPFWSSLREAFAVQLGDERHYPGDAETIANEMPLGAIVAVVDVVALARVDYYEPRPDDTDQRPGPFLNFGGRAEPLPDEPELSFGDYSVGRYIWKLVNIRALPEPVPCGGKQLLWDLDAATLAAVEGQLKGEQAHA
jgi:activating signal cointegrator 1